MGWKYWTVRPDWEGPRSFVALHHGAIVAHLAVWPVRVRVAGQVVTAVHGIDWAADRKYRGIGIRLQRQVAAKGRKNIQMMIATRRSAITRRILPLIRFRPPNGICPL